MVYRITINALPFTGTNMYSYGFKSFVFISTASMFLGLSSLWGKLLQQITFRTVFRAESGAVLRTAPGPASQRSL